MDFEWQCINLALDNRINKPGIDVQPYSNVGRRLLLPNTSASGTFLHSHYFLPSFSPSMLPHLFFFPSFFLQSFFLFFIVFLTWSPPASFLSYFLILLTHCLSFPPPSSRPWFSAVQWAAYRSYGKVTAFPLSPYCFASVFLSWQLLSVAPAPVAGIWTRQSSRHTGFTLHHSLSGC